MRTSSHSPTAGSTMKVFVSYSRRDSAIADALVEALTAQDFDVLIDRRSLPFGEKWQAELAEMIRTSHSVVWLISEASIRSEWVNWELDEVARRSKRLVPVMIGDVPHDQLPRQLGEIRVLPASGTFDVGRDLELLVGVLQSDRDWLRTAGRLEDRAHEWKGRGRAFELLLRGSALAAAERWKDERPLKAPAPAADVLDLLHASRRATTRRQRLAAIFGFSLAVVASAAALYMLALRDLATESERQARSNEARAISQERVAVAERDRAEANLRTANDTATAVAVKLNLRIRDQIGFPQELGRLMLDDARSMLKRLIELQPDNDAVVSNMLIVLVQMCDTLTQLRQLEAAVEVGSEAVTLSRNLVANGRNRDSAQIFLSIALDIFGDALMASDMPDRAREAYEEAVKIDRSLLELVTSGVHDRILHDLRRQLGGEVSSGARGDERDMEADRLRVTSSLLFSLAVAMIKVGDIERDGDPKKALAAYRESDALASRLQQLLHANPTRLSMEADGIKRQEYVAPSRMCNVLDEQRDHLAALEACGRAHQLQQAYPKHGAHTAQVTRDRALTLRNLAHAHEGVGDRNEADRAYQMAVDVSDQLVAADAGNARSLRDAVDLMFDYSEFLMRNQDIEKSAKLLDATLARAEQMRRATAGAPLAVSKSVMARLRRAVVVPAGQRERVEQAMVDLATIESFKGFDVDIEMRFASAILENYEILDELSRLADAGRWSDLQREASSRKKMLDAAEVRRSVAVAFELEVLEHLVVASLALGDLATARSTADQALTLSKNDLRFEARRAHALVLQGKEAEAGAIYRRFRGSRFMGDRWEDIVRKDLAGRPVPVFHEAERQRVESTLSSLAD